MGKHYEIDSEKLIETVRMHEQIWNKDIKEYHSKVTKEAAWCSVGGAMFEDWETVDETERSNKLFMLKKRWNNIRDYYKKDLALQLNGSIGQPSMKRKKYMFSNKLDFIRPSFEQRLAADNASDDDRVTDYVYEDFSSDNDESVRVKPKVSATEALEIEVQTDSTDDESDLLFLKSLAPDMKVLNRRQKIDFKLGILQLYKNITELKPQNDPLFDDDDEDKKFPMQ